MNRTKKVISLILALVMVAAVMLTGCGGNGGNGGGDGSKVDSNVLQIGVENKGFQRLD